MTFKPCLDWRAVAADECLHAEPDYIVRLKEIPRVR